MKIGIDARFLSYRHAGLGRYSTQLLGELLKLDRFNHYLLFVRPEETLPSNITNLVEGSSRRIRLQVIDASHYSLAEQVSFPPQIKNSGVDFIHCTHFCHPIYLRIPFVVTIHDLTLSKFLGQHPYLKRIAYRVVMKHAIQKSIKIITVSEFVKGQIIDEYKVAPEKIVTVYNGVDRHFKVLTNPLLLKKMAAKYGIKGPFLLYVGQWRSHKNLLNLVEAFYEVLKDVRFKNDLELVIIGRKEPRFTPLIERVWELGLTDRVIFTGFVEEEDLPALYNAAQLFVFPSLYEGFGLPPIEAMASGTPVVAAKTTSLPEVLGNAALYFDPLSVTQIAQAILRALKDGELRTDLRQEGFMRARRFSWQRTARETLKVYQEIGEKLGKVEKSPRFAKVTLQSQKTSTSTKKRGK